MTPKSGEKLVVSAASLIPAPPRRVYSIIADYTGGHPRILPKQFSGLVVESGGTDAGIIIRFNMMVFGRTQSFRAAVTEPEPGRVLMETDLETNGAVTQFIVDEGPSPSQSHVTITTELPVRGGILGAVEKFLATRYLRPIYDRELRNLSELAASDSQQTKPADNLPAKG